MVAMSLPLAWFLLRFLLRLSLQNERGGICPWPSPSLDTEGVGERGREAETEQDDKTSESRGGREAEGRKVDLAPQCQDPKNNNPVFLLLVLLSKWGFFFLSQKMVDSACCAAVASLASLQQGFPLPCGGDDRRQGRKRDACPPNRTTCRARVLPADDRPWQVWASMRGGGIIAILNFVSFGFPEKIPPLLHFSVCLQRKCGCLGSWLLPLANSLVSPSSSERTRCFLYIYLYLYISLYICFSLPSLSLGTAPHSWDGGVNSESPE